MPANGNHYIHTGRDGILDAAEESKVTSIISRLPSEQRVILHLHGGLVTKDAALDITERLTPVYQAAGAYPIFMIWESGFLETVRNNLHEIDKEAIFALLVKKLLKYTVGKLTDITGAKATGALQLPRDIEVAQEFKKRQASDLPFMDVARPAGNLTDLTDAERDRLENDLGSDIDFQEEVQSIVDGARPEAESKAFTSKGVTARHRRSRETLMSPEVVDELVADAAEKEGRGIFSSAALIRRAGRILWRVIRRFVVHRDHGVYATVVEEVLRELYVANVGSLMWQMMKKDTADTFDRLGEQPRRAGWLLFQELGNLMASGHRPEVSVVAHSAGAIYACNLLAHIDQVRDRDDHPLPKDFRLKNVVLLAPACDYRMLDHVLARHAQASLFEHFRMFALSDVLESGYWEVPGVYPRSLLYFVSGVVEKDTSGASASDHALVGMERYFTRTDAYDEPEVNRVRQFLACARTAVWSEDDRGPGLVSDAIRHGGFDDTDNASGTPGRWKTMAAVRHIVGVGW